MRSVVELIPFRELLLTLGKKTGEFLELKICERIEVRIPVDLSNLIIWIIVALVVAGETRACLFTLPYPVSTKTPDCGRIFPSFVFCVCKILK